MADLTKKFKIGKHKYVSHLMPPRKGLRFAVKFWNEYGGKIGNVGAGLAAVQEGASTADVIGIVATNTTGLDPDVLDGFIDQMGAYCYYEGDGKSEGMKFEDDGDIDSHFMGRTGDMMAWLYKCIEHQSEDFLDIVKSAISKEDDEKTASKV